MSVPPPGTHLAAVSSPDALAALAPSGGLAPLTARTFGLHAPDLHLAWLEGGALAARCSCWWRSAPPHAEHRLGLVGHYAARDADAARHVLEAAVDRLRAEGCTLAVGPMDGTTWRSYRLVTEACDRPPFFLEPAHPTAYPAHFAHAGFAPWAHYRSAEADLEEADLTDAPPPREAPADVRIRSMPPDAFDRTLARIYAVATESFAGNFLYAPITEDEFAAQYEALRPHLRPELVRLAERGGRLVGFCFTLPDHLQAERGVPVDTAILKTLAVRPEAAGQGLGGLLTADAHRTARALGFRRIIHALMYEDNRSNRISDRRAARTIRRYALYARPLVPPAP